MDSIYAYDDSSLYINLFTPSKLNWSQRNTMITQVTNFPIGGKYPAPFNHTAKCCTNNSASDTITLTVTGSGTWDLKIRIPSWTTDATIAVNDEEASEGTPGTYSTISRTWQSGDTVTVRLPMGLRLIAANDDSKVAVVAFGPVVLSGNYGDTTLSANPSLDLGSVKRTSDSALEFTGTADGATVSLSPFYDAHGYNYAVYWQISGNLS